MVSADAAAGIIFIVYGLVGFEARIWSGALSTLCLILDLVLWNPKFTTAAGGAGWGSKPALDGCRHFCRQQFMARHVRKNPACQILMTADWWSDYSTKCLLNELSLVFYTFYIHLYTYIRYLHDIHIWCGSVTLSIRAIFSIHCLWCRHNSVCIYLRYI